MQSLITLRIDEIVIERDRDDMGDLAALSKSIEDVGLLHPPVVRPVGDKYHVVAGRRRLAALRLLNWDEVDCMCNYDLDRDPDRPGRAERDENEQRKALAPSERARIYALLKQEEKAKAAARKGGRPPKTPDKKSEVSGGESAHIAATAAGMSKSTAEKALAVVEAAKADPALATVVEEMDKTGNVSAAHAKVLQAKAGPKDALGHLIEDENVRFDFEVGAELFKLLAKLHGVHSALSAQLNNIKHHAGVMEIISQVGVDFRNTKRTVETLIPYATIPADMKVSDEVRKRGWFNQVMFENLSERQKSAIRAPRG